MRKQFLVLSGDGKVDVLPSMFSLYKFSKAWGYSFRQILIGINYEKQWVGYNHQIELKELDYVVQSR